MGDHQVNIFLSQVSSNSTKDPTEIMLGTDNNQGRLINALMNANLALQKPNTVLVITGFRTDSSNNKDIQSRIDVVKQWFTAPKTINTGLSSSTLVDTKDYSAIPTNRISTKILDISINNNDVNTAADDPNPDDVIASDQSIINTIGDPDLQLGIISACQEVYALIGDMGNLKNEMSNIIEIGIFYKKKS